MTEGKVTNLGEFVVAAEMYGADITTHETDIRDIKAGRVARPRQDFHWWDSAPTGGCGMTGCGCSPGLWVSAAAGNRLVKAQFGGRTIGRGVKAVTQGAYEQWHAFKRHLPDSTWHPPGR